MEFKQLEAFINVVECASFSRAAEIMFLSQPSVSSYINMLEAELGCKLIYRSTKEVVETDAGKVLYSYAKKILLLREKAAFDVMSLKEKLNGKLTISASSVPAQYILPGLLKEFHKEFPDIIFYIDECDTEGVTKKVSSFASEIGIVGSKVNNSKCSFIEFASDELILVTPNTDEYKNILSLSQMLSVIESSYFIGREEGSGTRMEYENLLNNLNINYKNLKTVATFSNTASILNAVSKGLGVSIVSKLAAADAIKNNLVKHYTFHISKNKRKIYIVYRSDIELSPIANLFIEFMQNNQATSLNKPNIINNNPDADV